MPFDEFESVVFGKPFPDRKTEWYPYESKMVCCVTPTAVQVRATNTFT